MTLELIVGVSSNPTRQTCRDKEQQAAMFHAYPGAPAGHEHHWVAAVLFLVFAVIILGALAWAIITLLRQKEHHSQLAAKREGGPGALKILDERFARGEIEPDDYKTRRDLLNGE